MNAGEGKIGEEITESIASESAYRNASWRRPGLTLFSSRKLRKKLRRLVSSAYSA
jgi:hypothetical protein